MKIDKILEYQKIDQELMTLESEVAKSRERAILATAKSKIDTATETIKKLSNDASALLTGYDKMKNRLDELRAKLDQFDGIIEEVADPSEADHYLKLIGAIAEEIVMLEKDSSRDASKIDNVNENYKKTWEAGTKASGDFKQAKLEYDTFVKERQPKVSDISGKLEKLKSEIPSEIFDIYNTLRKAKTLPAFVAFNPSKSTCDRCFMDIPNNTKGRLKNPGDYVECPNCRRILYLPE